MKNYFQTHLPKLLTLTALLIVPSACLLQAASVTPAGTAPLSEPDTKHVAAQTTPQQPNAAQDLLKHAVLRMNASDASEHFKKAIAAGADVSKKIVVFHWRPEGCWPLQSTIFCNNIKCVPLLLDAGAPVAVPETSSRDPIQSPTNFWEQTPLELAATAYDKAYRQNMDREIVFGVIRTEESAMRKLRQAKTVFKMILHAHSPTSTEVASFPWQNFHPSLRDLTLEVAQEKMDGQEPLSQNVSTQRDAQVKDLLVKQNSAFKDLYPIIQGYAQQTFVEYLEDQEKQSPAATAKK